jgi:Ca2+-dependent lipid-binding protein
MKRFFTEISYDVNFLKGHKLQPAWFKVFKIFILLALLAGFILLFGWRRAAVFTVVFVLLMLVVHMIYRANTRKFTRNWMDFIVVEDAERSLKQGIGAVYYASIVLNAVIAFFLSGMLAG